MKTIQLLIVLFFAAAPGPCGFSQKSDSRDKIKSLIITKEDNESLVKRQFTESETFYDQKGNIIEDISYKQGKINKHFKYQYDSDNNKIREEKYDPSGRLTEISEYKIENGLRVEKRVYDKNNRLKSIRNYQYTFF